MLLASSPAMTTPRLLALLLVLLGTAGGAGARPARPPCDMATLVSAQLALAAACPCETAVNHGQYVSCAAHWAVQAVHDGTLPRGDCRRRLRRAVVHSTCGKPDVATCCRQGPAGTRCIIRSPAFCLRAGGTVGATASCLDACVASPSGAFLAPAASLF